jgi:hypothetical protein
MIISLLSVVDLAYSQSSSSQNSTEQQITLLGANIITAISAVGGGVVGAIVTYWHNRKIEEQKNDYAIEAEKSRKSSLESERKEFNAKMRTIIKEELIMCSAVAKTILRRSELGISELDIAKFALEHHDQYHSIPIERRIGILNHKTLQQVESAYNLFVIVFESLATEFKYEKADKLDLSKTTREFGESQISN